MEKVIIKALMVQLIAFILLLASSYYASALTLEIQNDLNCLIINQKPEGSWENRNSLTSVNYLKERQNEEGGWGFTEDDDSNAYTPVIAAVGLNHLFAFADLGNAIIERDENNNMAVAGLMADKVDIMLAAPDLKLSPGYPVAGDTVFLAVTARNTGIATAGAFDLSINKHQLLKTAGYLSKIDHEQVIIADRILSIQGGML